MLETLNNLFFDVPGAMKKRIGLQKTDAELNRFWIVGFEIGEATCQSPRKRQTVVLLAESAQGFDGAADPDGRRAPAALKSCVQFL